MRKLAIAGAALIHPLVHVATLGLDDLFIIIIVGGLFLWRSN